MRRVREALGMKLQAALRDEVGLVERIQGLEAEKAALEERVAVLIEGQSTTDRTVSSQLDLAERDRARDQKTADDHRLAHEEVKRDHV